MCTTIVFGGKASADGSFIVARSADSSSLKAQHFVIHPARQGQTGFYSCKAHGGVNDFTYPLPENSLRYTTIPNWKTQLHGACGFNEAGMGLTGTESIFARDDALKLDPYTSRKRALPRTTSPTYCSAAAAPHAKALQNSAASLKRRGAVKVLA